jgi:hypothetical protein
VIFIIFPFDSFAEFITFKCREQQKNGRKLSEFKDMETMFREGEVDDKIDMRGERGMEKVFCFHLEADNGQKVSHRSLE